MTTYNTKNYEIWTNTFDCVAGADVILSSCFRWIYVKSARPHPFETGITEVINYNLYKRSTDRPVATCVSFENVPYKLFQHTNTYVGEQELLSDIINVYSTVELTDYTR